MAIVPVLGFTVFMGGLCFLAGRGILKACKVEREEGRVTEGGAEDPFGELPDRVPSEWIQAYRAEKDG